MLHVPSHDPGLYRRVFVGGRVEDGEEGVPSGEKSGARRRRRVGAIKAQSKGGRR